DLFQKIKLRPAGVFRAEFHVPGVLKRLLNALDADADDLLAAFFELVLAVNFGGGAEDVNAPLGGVLDGFAGALDVFGRRSRQPADDRAADLRGDGADGFEIPIRGDGKAGLDDVDAHLLEVAGDLDFFRAGEGGAGRLLAVA